MCLSGSPIRLLSSAELGKTDSGASCWPRVHRLQAHAPVHPSMRTSFHNENKSPRLCPICVCVCWGGGLFVHSQHLCSLLLPRATGSEPVPYFPLVVAPQHPSWKSTQTQIPLTPNAYSVQYLTFVCICLPLGYSSDDGVTSTFLLRDKLLKQREGS